MALPHAKAAQAAFLRTVITAAANPRSAEVHSGLVESSTVVTLSNNVKKCSVYVDGASVAQLCRYNEGYTPSAGDHVVLLLMGGDNRQRQRYIVAFALAHA